jgi:S-formylglutathione hydrolase FrmB
MKKIAALLFSIGLFSAMAFGIKGPSLAYAFEGTLEDSTFYSASLSREMPYRLYLPPDYFDAEALSTRYPVLYLLHGHETEENYLAHTYWTERTEISTLADAYGMMIVFAEGLRSWYSNYHDSEPGTNRFEDYIVFDLIDHIDATYRTRPDRESRAIMGNSMGGHGAMKLAALHPDRFCAAAGLSGIFDLARIGVASFLDPIIPNNLGTVFGAYPANLLYYEGNSTVALAPNFVDPNAAGGTHTRLLFSSGLLDHYFAQIWAVEYARVLDGLGIAYDATLHGGDPETAGHTWTYWGDHIEEVLAFVSAAFETPPASPERWRYRTIEPSFQVWDWSIRVSRMGDWAWVEMVDVDEHGFDFMCDEPTESLRVETPPFYAPRSRFQIVTSDSTGEVISETHGVADPTGSLQFTVEFPDPWEGEQPGNRTVRVQILQESVPQGGASSCGGCTYVLAIRRNQGAPSAGQLMADLAVFLIPVGWMVILLRWHLSKG